MEFQHKPEKRPTYKEKARAGLIEKKPRQVLTRTSKLKPASDKKQVWLKRYRDQKESDQLTQKCQVCGNYGRKTEMDAHHTEGRAGAKILIYIYVHRECHDWIHGHPKQAREKGLLNF